jgi:quercetin dioxygenase-like cupin family protein
VPLSYLLLEDDVKPQVVGKQERNIVHIADGGPKAAILSLLPARSLELILLELPLRKASWMKEHFHEGQECHLVVKGKVRAYHGDDSYLLEEGDSIFWDGTAPHRMENVGDREAQIFIALTPPSLLPLERAEDLKGDKRQLHVKSAGKMARRPLAAKSQASR